ncbi:MAG: hypothetical protein KatS3mg081_2168 [Gemmatimonadales bacterium]|nr:MAG: hypothetical protein KatS3mg081_2168 [Gemmatimonadales bacterium]
MVIGILGPREVACADRDSPVLLTRSATIDTLATGLAAATYHAVVVQQDHWDSSLDPVFVAVCAERPASAVWVADPQLRELRLCVAGTYASPRPRSLRDIVVPDPPVGIRRYWFRAFAEWIAAYSAAPCPSCSPV